MHLLKRKINNEEFNYERYLNEFIAFRNSEDKNREYNSLANLYNEVDTFYRDMMRNGELDIKVERMLLQRRAGKYISEKSKNNITLLIGLSCALTPIYIQGFIELNYKYKGLVSIGIAIILFITVTKGIGKDIVRDKNQDVMHNICLKVLEDIEKDNFEKEHKTQIIKLNTSDEVAATVLEEEPTKNHARPVSQQANGNWNITVSAPSIIDTVESIYKLGKFAKKIFRKK